MPWFECAVKRQIPANTGGTLSPNLGLVLHHAVMNGSLFSYFSNPAVQVSAHFWVSQTGVIEQYVDTNVVAWHGRDLNSRYVGVETEGCVKPPHDEPMSEAMINGLARLYAEGMSKHGWPTVLSNANGQPGFGYHRMAVNTACPCDVRLNKRQEILFRAQGGGSTVPLPPEVENMIPAPLTFMMPSGGQQVFYVDSEGSLHHYYFNSSTQKWIGEKFTKEWEPNSGLAAGPTPENSFQVWGTFKNGKRAQCYWSGNKWVTQALP